MPKIIHEKAKCIGCGSCVALCPEYWEMQGEKSHLKGSHENPDTGNNELEIEEVGCNREAAESCPVQIIYIIEK